MRTDCSTQRAVRKPRSSVKKWTRVALRLAEKLPPDREAELVALTGLSIDDLRPLAIGWSERDRAFSTALWDGAGAKVIGLLLWRPDGFVRVQGCPGLVLPPDLIGLPPLAMVDEPTRVAADTLAAIAGQAVGVPTAACFSVASGFVKRQKPSSAAILLHDSPAARSAASILAVALKAGLGSGAAISTLDFKPVSKPRGQDSSADRTLHAVTRAA